MPFRFHFRSRSFEVKVFFSHIFHFFHLLLTEEIIWYKKQKKMNFTNLEFHFLSQNQDIKNRFNVGLTLIGINVISKVPFYFITKY
jgi:hypothetical protein